MDYLSKGSCLVVVGGRTDNNGVLNQVFLFLINHSIWQEVKMLGDCLERCCQATTAYSSKIYIFGGISNITYVRANLYSIETGTSNFLI